MLKTHFLCTLCQIFGADLFVRTFMGDKFEVDGAVSGGVLNSGHLIQRYLYLGVGVDSFREEGSSINKTSAFIGV